MTRMPYWRLVALALCRRHARPPWQDETYHVTKDLLETGVLGT